MTAVGPININKNNVKVVAIYESVLLIDGIRYINIQAGCMVKFRSSVLFSLSHKGDF